MEGLWSVFFGDAVLRGVTGSHALTDGGNKIDAHSRDNADGRTTWVSRVTGRCDCRPRTDAAEAYRLIHGRVDALLRGRTDVAELAVPACPAWTVRQTVAHLAGVAEDILSDNLEDLASDSWTQAQIDRLASNSIDELLDLWMQTIAPLTQRIGKDGLHGSACQLVFDSLSHEHDIRGALGEPGTRTGDPAFVVAMEFLTTSFDQKLRRAGRSGLRLTSPTMGLVQLGDSSTSAGQVVLSVSDFEALRAFGGRRSVQQLLALPWHGDPRDVLAAFENKATRPPKDDLVE